MSERELLYGRLEELLKVMDGLDPEGEIYQKMVRLVEVFGQLINKESEIDEKNLEMESHERIEEAKLNLEREKLEAENRRAREANETTVKRAKLELIARVVQGAFMVIGMILNLKGLGWILRFEKTGSITSKAFQFVSKGLPKFV